MTDYVLDSYALTAYVQNEPGGMRMEELFRQAEAGDMRLAMTTINLGETLYITYRRQGVNGWVTVMNLTADLPVEIVDATLPLTVIAARIKAVTPISYGDCFAAALGLDRGYTVITGDREFERVEHLVPVEWLPDARY